MNAYKVYFLLALCVLIWSGNFVLGRYLSTSVEPIELAFFRWFFVLIFITPSLFFLDLKKLLRVFKQNLKIMLSLSILGITLFNTIVYLAVQTTTATNGLLINSTTPIIILILAHFILKAHINKLQILGIILSTFGVSFLILKGNILSITNLEFHDGDFLILLSSSIWALYSVLIKFRPKELNSYELFVSLVIVGFIILLPVYLAQGYSIEREIASIKQNWYLYVYISLFASITSYYLWHIGLDTIGAARTGQFTHLMPLFGSTLAFIFLGETLESYHIYGAILIGLGIYLSLFLKEVNEE